MIYRKGWRKYKDKWNRRYKRYLEEIERQKKRTGVTGPNAVPLNKKSFKKLWEAMGNTSSKKAKSVEIANQQLFPGASSNTAKRVMKTAKESGIELGFDEIDIRTGNVSTADIAEALNLGQVYHDKKDELMKQGMTAKEASAEASHYVSWYYFGSL